MYVFYLVRLAPDLTLKRVFFEKYFQRLFGCTVRVTHNGTFVQSPPTNRPTSVGFLLPIGRQRVGGWYTRAIVRGFRRIHPNLAGCGGDPLQWPHLDP